MIKEFIDYKCGGTKCKGYAVYDSSTKAKRPAIIVAHAWMGQDDFAREKATYLTKLGYLGFAADLYGDGKTVQNSDEAAALMMPLFLDRKLLQERIIAAYRAVQSHPLVVAERIGAIGFCFGGLSVIELLRSGTEIKGAVSFHGALGNSRDGKKAKTVPIAQDIKGSLLMLHGHDDPLVSQDDILNMQTELTKAGVDWQMHIYGHTVHAFTNPVANDAKSGFAFNPKSNERAWKSMRNFFEEIFQ